MINIKKTNIFGLYLLFFLFTLSGFIPGSTKHLGAEENKVNGKPESLPPQPTLVAGDIESLIPLAETHYLDGKPVLLFSGAHQSSNPYSLLNYSNSVVFHKQGCLELLLELFPSTGTAITNDGTLAQAQNTPQYRFAVGNNPLVLDIAEEAYYRVFAKKKNEIRDEIKNNFASVKVDEMELETPFDDLPDREGVTRWQGFAKTYLPKGRHSFTADSEVSELLIIPQEVFQDYYEKVKDILQKKHVSYLLSFNEETEKTVSKDTINTNEKNFVVANPGEYQLRAYVSPIKEKIVSREVGFKLSEKDLFSDNNIIQDAMGNEAATIPFSEHELDIESFPNMEISYNLADPSAKRLISILQLDTTGDDRVDALFSIVENKQKEGEIEEIEEINVKLDFAKVKLKKKDFWYKAFRELGWGKNVDLYQWYYESLDSSFSHYVEQNTLVVSSDFSKSNHFVITNHFQPINLKENQMVRLDYKLEKPDQQSLWINFKLDTNGDGRPDKIISTENLNYGLNIKDGYTRQCMNVLALSGVDPKDEKSKCYLVEVIVLCSGKGRYYIKEFCNGRKKEIVDEEPMSFSEFQNKISDNKVEIVCDNVKRKRDGAVTVLSINDIFQQIKSKMTNIKCCKVKSMVFFLPQNTKLQASIPLQQENLRERLKGVQFFNNKTIEIPKFIAEKINKKVLKEGGFEYDGEEIADRINWSKKWYNMEECVIDEIFVIDNIGETISANSQTDKQQNMQQGKNIDQEKVEKTMQRFVGDIREECPLLHSLSGTVFAKSNFPGDAHVSNKFLINKWKLHAKNAFYRLFYDEKGLNIQGLFYCSGKERFLTIKKDFDGINLQKYPYLRFQFQEEEDLDSNEEKLWVELRGRCNPNGDFIVRLGGSSFKDEQGFCVNLLRELKQKYNDSTDFILNDISICLNAGVNEFDENLLTYGSDARSGDKEFQASIKSLQIFGIRDKNFGELLKNSSVQAANVNTVSIEDIEWTSKPIVNTQYQHKSFDNGQHVGIRFERDGINEEGVIVKATFKQPLELNYLQEARFEYTVDKPNIQGIVVVPEFNTLQNSSSISFLNLKEENGCLSFNITEKAREIYDENELSSIKLTALLFYLIKRPGIRCNNDKHMNTYSFSIKDLRFVVLEPPHIASAYDNLFYGPLFELNGRKYSFGDGLKTGNGVVKSNEESFAASISKIAQLMEKGKIALNLGNIEIAEENCKIDVYSQSKYFNVDMVELTKPGEHSIHDTNAKEPEITFRKINPTRYVVDVKAERPFWLVFSESFHAGWKAYGREKKEGGRQKAEDGTEKTGIREQGLGARGQRLEGGDRRPEVNGKNEEHWSALMSAQRDKGNRIELTEHQMVNGYANGWYVPVGEGVGALGNGLEAIEAGDFQIILEYKPQRLFEIGILISGITFVLCIGYLCYCGIRNIITKKKKIILSTDFTD